MVSLPTCHVAVVAPESVNQCHSFFVAVFRYCAGSMLGVQPVVVSVGLTMPSRYKLPWPCGCAAGFAPGGKGINAPNESDAIYFALLCPPASRKAAFSIQTLHPNWPNTTAQPAPVKSPRQPFRVVRHSWRLSPPPFRLVSD